MIVVCSKCGRQVEADVSEVEFNDDGFGFVYCPFCEGDEIEIYDIII